MSAAPARRGIASEPSDAELMLRLRDDDTDAFEQLYDRHSAAAYRVAGATCHRPEEAVQEAFISIWRSRRAYRPGRGDVAAWTMAAVRNHAIDISRSDTKHTSGAARLEPWSTSPAPSAPAPSAPTTPAVLAGLPAAQREVITLAFYGELSHTEIAAHLELPVGTVKGRMRLGLRQLRGFR